MLFWLFMLAMALLCPATMIVFGKRFISAPPKEINSVYGYRTRRSMKNGDTWRFAHTCFGTLWLRLGVITLPLSFAAMLFSVGRSARFVGLYGLGIVLVQMLPMLLPVVFVEERLKRTFDEDGKRKSF